MYASILRKIEAGSLAWNAQRLEFTHWIQWTLMMQSQSSASGRSQARYGEKSQAKGSKEAWCLQFNRAGGCSLKAPHVNVINGQEVEVGHFCAACYAKSGEKKAHSKMDLTCTSK